MQSNTFMAVHAHPDDEAISTGGTFALLAARGYRTVLVTATLGEEGNIVDPALDEHTRQAMQPRLAEIRRMELQASVKALNISDSHVLGFRDSGMAGSDANNHPDSFHRVFFDDAVRRLVAIIRDVRPQVIVTYNAFGDYGHPDHIQAHRITMAAFDAASEPRCFPELQQEAWQPRKLYFTAVPRSYLVRAAKQAQIAKQHYPDFAIDMDRANRSGTPDELITTRIDAKDYIEAKLEAFRAHKTQISPDNMYFKLRPMDQRFVLGYEYFVLARHVSPLSVHEREEDLFAGLV